MEQKPNVARELEKMPYEPLLPIEMTLIRWSLGLGVGLLLVLILVNYAFFPAN